MTDPRAHLVGDSAAVLDPAALVGWQGGARWRLEESPRQLDANVVHLPAHHNVDSHAEPALDVLLHVLQGSGSMAAADGTIELVPGRLVWLPRGSRRSIEAGADGLSYLTVHSRRPGLAIGKPPGGA